MIIFKKYNALIISNLIYVIKGIHIAQNQTFLCVVIQDWIISDNRNKFTKQDIFSRKMFKLLDTIMKYSNFNN